MRKREMARLALTFLAGKEGGGGHSTARRNVIGAIIGIALSLVPLIMVFELSDGMIDGIMRRSIELGTYHLRAIPYDYPSDSALLAQADEISKMEGVKSALVERQGSGVAVLGETTAGVSVRALDARAFTEDPSFRELITVKKGALAFPKENSVILGEALAARLKARVGSRLTLMTMDSGDSRSLSPRVHLFTVSGIVSSGYQELDALWFLVPLATGTKVLGEKSSYAFIGVKTEGLSASHGLDSHDPVIGKLSDRLSENYQVQAWYDFLRSQLSTLKTTKLLLIFITVLIVVVACLNVSAATYMLVFERQQDIFILRSLGLSPTQVSLIFGFCGLAMGLIALVAGLSLGLLLAANVNGTISFLEGVANAVNALVSAVGNLDFKSVKILNPAYYLEKIPIRLNFLELLLAGVGTVLVSGLAAFIPARGSEPKRPMDIVRKI
jgi:lipoprotein-releasing system permease protein